MCQVGKDVQKTHGSNGRAPMAVYRSSMTFEERLQRESCLCLRLSSIGHCINHRKRFPGNLGGCHELIHKMASPSAPSTTVSSEAYASECHDHHQLPSTRRFLDVYKSGVRAFVMVWGQENYFTMSDHDGIQYQAEISANGYLPVSWHCIWVPDMRLAYDTFIPS